MGQLVADVFNTDVIVLSAADEGCAWGAALLAKYTADVVSRPQKQTNAACASDSDSCSIENWSSFLETMLAQNRANSSATRFAPRPTSVEVLEIVLQRYKKLVSLQQQLADIME